MISIEGERQTTYEYYKNKQSKSSFLFNIPEVKHQHWVYFIEEQHNLGLPSVIWLVVGDTVEVEAQVDEGLLVMEVLVTTGLAEEVVVVWMALWDDEWWDWT